MRPRKKVISSCEHCGHQVLGYSWEIHAEMLLAGDLTGNHEYSGTGEAYIKWALDLADELIRQGGENG